MRYWSKMSVMGSSGGSPSKGQSSSFQPSIHSQNRDSRESSCPSALSGTASTKSAKLQAKRGDNLWRVRPCLAHFFSRLMILGAGSSCCYSLPRLDGVIARRRTVLTSATPVVRLATCSSTSFRLL